MGAGRGVVPGNGTQHLQLRAVVKEIASAGGHEAWREAFSSLHASSRHVALLLSEPPHLLRLIDFSWPLPPQALPLYIGMIALHAGLGLALKLYFFRYKDIPMP